MCQNFAQFTYNNTESQKDKAMPLELSTKTDGIFNKLSLYKPPKV